MAERNRSSFIYYDANFKEVFQQNISMEQICDSFNTPVVYKDKVYVVLQEQCFWDGGDEVLEIDRKTGKQKKYKTKQEFMEGYDLQKRKMWFLLGICLLVIASGFVFRQMKGDRAETDVRKEEESNESVNIWIMGDSLAAANGKNPDSDGWGAMLEQYFKGDVRVRNSAAGGASASSYVQNGMCKMVLDSLEKGDYVIIQFGHNDVWYEDRLTDPYGSSEKEGSFKYLLKNEYIKPILEKGAYPILATSVVSCSYDESGELYRMLYADHAQAMRDLTKECEKEGMNVVLVDTYAITDKLYRKLGEAEAWKFHSDEVHYNNYGAAYVAGLIVEELKKEGIPCCQEVYTFEEVVAASEKLQKAIKN